MKVIVGLGNPGERYMRTRHNFGFMVLDRLAADLGLEFSEDRKFKALVARQSGLILVKPQAYMNNSGEAVAAVLDYYKLLPRQFKLLRVRDADLSAALTVVHDDLDINFGTWKESIDSRSAGQKGVQSIIDRLKTKNFRRLRLGIKTDKKPAKMPAADFVLQKFNAEEMETVRQVIAAVAAAEIAP